MKTRFSLAFVCLLVNALLLPGCGARMDVATDKALQKLDEMLGTMDVRRKEIDLQLTGLSSSVTGLKKAKAKADAKIDELGRKTEPLKKKQQDIKNALAKYREYLEKNEPAIIAGNTLTVEQLKANATKLTTAYKQITDQLVGLEQSANELSKVRNGFETKQQEIQSHIDSLTSKVGQIDAQMTAVRSMREAKAAIGDTNITLSENVVKLENKVNDLLADVRVEMAVEGEAFDEKAATSQMSELDKMLLDVHGPTDTVADIDAILGS